MKPDDIIYSIMIIIIYLLMFAFGIAVMNTNEIRDNWDIYKCNPAYMPFSQSIKGVDPEENMVGCMKNMSGEIMNYALEPVEASMSVIKVLITTIISTVSDLQGFATDLTSTNSSSFGSMFDSVGGVTTMFSGIIDNLLDAIYRTSAIASVLQYMAQGVTLTSESLDNALCFHPETLITMEDNKQKYIKDIELGDIIVNGSRVEGIMKLHNVDRNGKIKNKFYRIESNKQPIYVTGEHLVLDKNKREYLKVENYDKSTLTNKSSEVLVCLITSDHRIVIDDQIFWDWEDEWFYK